MKLPDNIVSELDKLAKSEKLRTDWSKYPDVDEILKRYYNKVKGKTLVEYIRKLYPEMSITVGSMEHRHRAIS